MILAQLRARRKAPGYGMPHELHAKAHGGRPLWALNRWRCPFFGRFPGARPGAGLKRRRTGVRTWGKKRGAHGRARGRLDGHTHSVSDAESIRLLGFFMEVVAHQVGNSLTPLSALHAMGDEYQALNRGISMGYKRIMGLCKLASSQLKGCPPLKKEISGLELTEAELTELGVEGVSAGWSVSIAGVRKFVGKEAKKLGALLLQLESEKEELLRSEQGKLLGKVIPNVLMYGIHLSKCIEEVAGGSWTWDSESGSVELGSIFGETLRSDPLVEIRGLDEAGGNPVRVNVVFAKAIVSNVISNAKRAMEGMPDPKPIEVNIWTEGEFAVVHFRDHGCGMGPGKMKRINRGEAVNSTKTEAGTHGIGLKCCGEMARGMRGSLRVANSKLGEGTLIELKMKLAGRKAEVLMGCS